jgi:two-component system, OmpR family, sensor histidine kinase VicK
MVDKYVQFKTIREIGDLSNEGVIIFSLVDNRIIYCNNTAAALTGLSDNGSERTIESLLHSVTSEDREYLRNRYLQVRNESASAEFEVRLVNSQPKETFVCCNAYLVEEGTCIVLYIRDISRPKEHESYLVEFGAKKNTLLDTLTHHISGALNLMRHLTDEAEKSLALSDNENLVTYFSLVKENSKHCIEIIDELMKDEHSESPKIFVKKTRIDLVEKVSFIFHELQVSYPLRSFLFNTSGPSIYINTDEVKLLQVVNNLTSNAIKFTPVKNEISISIEEQDTEVIVSVSDKGIGIPYNLQPFIFDRHGLAGRTGLNGEKSKGLGLSICKSLVGLLGGEMWFVSEEGQGSIFYFRLPKE